MIRIACLSVSLALGALASLPNTARAQEAQVAPPTALAQEAPALYRMLDGLGMYEIIALMGTENTRGGADLEEQLFPGAGGAAWRATVAGLHATPRMVGLFEDAFDRDAVSPDQIAIVQAFIDSEAGQRVIGGELAARRMFLDEAAVEAATENLMAAIAADSPRLEILQRLNAVSGLVDRNVSGALNLRIAFYRGLIDGGAFDNDVPESMMLAEVWAQEPEVRHLTVEWLFSFQLAAYAEVTDADLEAYVALADAPAGRAVNAALFNAFDEMLATLSYDLGVAAAGFIVGEDT
ncbi:hypothetical protein A8B78_17490 [Jannaschia sp. EhC01]|nr:hypothetical protein A8B78_17490 [Jannaschia sp. EhC01]